jgi:hypothetical protein
VLGYKTSQHPALNLISHQFSSKLSKEISTLSSFEGKQPDYKAFITITSHNPFRAPDMACNICHRCNQTNMTNTLFCGICEGVFLATHKTIPQTQQSASKKEEMLWNPHGLTTRSNPTMQQFRRADVLEMIRVCLSTPDHAVLILNERREELLFAYHPERGCGYSMAVQGREVVKSSLEVNTPRTDLPSDAQLFLAALPDTV